MNTSIIRFLACCLCLINAQNMIVIKDEFQINTETLNSQLRPYATSLSNGKFLVVWQGEQTVDSNIYGKIFRDDGSLFKDEFTINTEELNDQTWTSASALKNGNFMVVWQDESLYDIKGQLYDDNGDPYSNELRINYEASKRQEYPHISASNINSEWIVVWQGRGPEYDTEIYSHRINMTSPAIPTDSDTLISSLDLANKTHPTIASLNDGRYIVVFFTFDEDRHLFGRFLNTLGIPTGSQFPIDQRSNWQEYPVVASLANGRFVCTWQSYGEDGDAHGVFAQIFEMNGDLYGDKFQVNNITDDIQWDPTVTGLDDGLFVIVFSSPDPEYDQYNEIFGQVFNNDGSKWSAELNFRVNDIYVADQKRSTITRLDKNKFVVAYQSYNLDTSGHNIFAKIYQIIDEDTDTNLMLYIYIGLGSIGTATLAFGFFVLFFRKKKPSGQTWNLPTPDREPGQETPKSNFRLPKVSTPSNKKQRLEAKEMFEEEKNLHHLQSLLPKPGIYKSEIEMYDSN